MNHILDKKKYKIDTFIPPELEKIRKRFEPELEIELIDYNEQLFSQFFPSGNGIDLTKYQITNIGRYSMSNTYSSTLTANYIYEYYSKFFKPENISITDATANMGGDTIAFAQKFTKVNSIEIMFIHYQVLVNNIKNAKLDHNVNTYWANYLDIADKLSNDIVFMDAPWGGTDYKNNETMDLFLDNINVKDISNLLLSNKYCKMVTLKVPKNYNMNGLDKFKFFIKDIYNKKNILKYKLIFLFQK